jgi:pseudouridine synthase
MAQRTKRDSGNSGDGDQPNLKDASRGERLHKALADAGIGSRRACEQLIAEGAVSVNGRIIRERDMPVWVDLNVDRVEVEGRPVGRPKRRSHLYIMVNKPSRVVSTNKDPEGRKTVRDLVPHKERLFPVGRLDFEATGLVLLTDDGKLANQLTHPRYEVPKTYDAIVKGQVQPGALEQLKAGIWIPSGEEGKNVKAKVDDIEIIDSDETKTRVRLTLREGNRDLRAMFGRFGHDIKRLTRTGLGPLQMKGVALGGWRELSQIEVHKLRRAAKRTED